MPGEPRTVLLNDLPYKDGVEDPRRSLRDTLAFAVDDWGSSRAMAWTYGIVLGWDDDDHPNPEPDDDAMAEIAKRFRWDEATVARLRRLHASFEAEAAAINPEWLARALEPEYRERGAGDPDAPTAQMLARNTAERVKERYDRITKEGTPT